MLTICIPVFNFDVSNLVLMLEKQIAALGNEVDILCIDDASDDKFKMINRPICQKHRYIELENNIGRSRIRNLLAQEAKNQYLLFLDCDAIIINDNFVGKYLFEIKQSNPDVMCGGRVYDGNYPGRSKRLRWKYGHLKESRSALDRIQNPNKSFMTNNFVVRRDLLMQIPFDESLTQYGHEDTLIGYEFLRKNIKIKHIENPILNGDVEDNDVFLSKTEQGLDNLVKLYVQYKNNKEFVSSVTLLRTVQRLKKLNILILFFYRIFKAPTRLLLLKGFANMKVFDFYKLGFFIEKLKKTSV